MWYCGEYLERGNNRRMEKKTQLGASKIYSSSHIVGAINQENCHTT
jgi:hypothetical protein